VPVKKKNGKWRMCIDFTDLNKTCPKDDYPLPRIDTIVDDAANSEMMSLLDCFSGYHQIWMNKEDEEKTSFITPSGTYCFVRMPEGLKNAGPTFTRMTKVVFKPQICKNLLAYVDDIIIKSNSRPNHISDLAETFANLRKANLKLNPEKCVFGVTKGKMLGCLVASKGIEANADKVRALADMQEPKSIKDIQKLTGRIAALNRFVPRAAERSLPFFKVLRNSGKFQWGPEQSEAFQQLKQYLAQMIKLSPPQPGKQLLLYLSASKSAVSAALIQEAVVEGNLRQLPVYFVSEALSGAKLLYSEYEKFAYALVMTTRKLKHYFEAHSIAVVIDKPIADLFANKQAPPRIAKWATEVSAFSITFVRRNSIKSQVLADFISDWTSPSEEQKQSDQEPWVIHCDGAYGEKGSAAAAVIISPSGNKTRFAARLEFDQPCFKATNNVAEYEAVLLGLRRMKALGQPSFIIKTDSKVVTDHVEKQSEARELMKYLEEVRAMERHFKGFTVQHIPRNKNNEADTLAKAAANSEPLPPDVIYEVIKTPSIRKRYLNHIRWEDWRSPIVAYLSGTFEPTSNIEYKRVEQRAKTYLLYKNELYKSGVTQPYLKCIPTHQGIEILKGINSGYCGGHISARALAGKAIRQGFFWPTIVNDAAEVAKTCEACQMNANNQKAPAAISQLITPSWPLQRWGIDLVGPLPTAQGNCRFAVVVVEYFTKWIEAKAISSITSQNVQKFFWQNIVCRFGVPREITVDNGKQFDSQLFKDFCHSIGTKVMFASVYHPQSNGAVERANGLIFCAIKKCLYNQAKGKCVAELPKVIFSHNTTESRATKFTPFRLLYGAEAMIPEEIMGESLRVTEEQASKENLALDKDLAEVDRIKACHNLETYQRQTRAWRDKKVKLKQIAVGDFVIKRKPNAEIRGKFQEKWEGPFIVSRSNRPRSFYLKDEYGNELPHSWNVDSLQRYYV
jgi:ribonuclease HI